MEEQRYLISEASRKTGTEAHVLRYWEEELALKIPRNELGNRYYTESHIELFQEIQELKNKGYSLKAIRDILVGNELVGEEDLEPNPAYSEGEAAPLTRQLLFLTTRSYRKKICRSSRHASWSNFRT